jgi:membrane protein required for colicin V production
MNLLDIIIIALLATLGLRGLLRGLIKEAAALVALVAGGWLAYKFHGVVATPLRDMFNMPAVAADIAGFVILLLLVGLLAHFGGNLLTSLIKLALLGWVNRIGGLCLGLVEACLVLGMAFYAITAIPVQNKASDAIRSHTVANKLAKWGGVILDRARSIQKGS